jgi:hypothetical protein
MPAMASSQGVMFVLVPDAKTPATSTVRHVPYLLVRDFEYVLLRPERHRAQSCAIALRSPAPQRCFRADIHHDFRLKL